MFFSVSCPFVQQVPVIENSVCQEMFHMAGHNKKILPSFVCAGYANGKRDSCEVSFVQSRGLGQPWGESVRFVQSTVKRNRADCFIF